MIPFSELMLRCDTGVGGRSENTMSPSPSNMGYDTIEEICGHRHRTMGYSVLLESGRPPPLKSK